VSQCLNQLAHGLLLGVPPGLELGFWVDLLHFSSLFSRFPWPFLLKPEEVTTVFLDGHER